MLRFTYQTNPIYLKTQYKMIDSHNLSIAVYFHRVAPMVFDQLMYRHRAGVWRQEQCLGRTICPRHQHPFPVDLFEKEVRYNPIVNTPDFDCGLIAFDFEFLCIVVNIVPKLWRRKIHCRCSLKSIILSVISNESLKLDSCTCRGYLILLIWNTESLLNFAINVSKILSASFDAVAFESMFLMIAFDDLSLQLIITPAIKITVNKGFVIGDIVAANVKALRSAGSCLEQMPNID